MNAQWKGALNFDVLTGVSYIDPLFNFIKIFCKN